MRKACGLVALAWFPLGAAWAQSPVQVDESAVRLSFAGEHFLVDLPVTGAGTVQVRAQLVGTRNEIASQASSPCVLGSGVTHCRLELPPYASPGKASGSYLPRVRLRYSAGVTAGIVAVSQIAPELYELHVAGPANVHPGASYTARVRALHPVSGEPRGGVALLAKVTAVYTGDADDRVILRTHVRTDAQGFARVEFIAPETPTLDAVELEVEGRIANLTTGTSQTFRVPEAASADLTSDKPLYQPEQTVHTRLLLLDRKGDALAKTKVRFDFRDPDSTLVYRADGVTSSFGIATADWTVPASMRLGTYNVQATPEDGPQGYASIRVSRYDLPTFTVDPIPDRAFYLPGQNAVVKVRASYLFGKPVVHGHVRVLRESERTWNFAQQRYDTKEGAAVEGELDGSGSFVAHIDLAEDEKAYADEDISNQFKDVHLAAYVTDASTGRTEQRRFDVRVTAQALHVYVTTEQDALRGQGLTPFVAVTSADGTPVAADLAVSLLPPSTGQSKETLAGQLKRARLLQRVHTDARGIARLDLGPFETLAGLATAGHSAEPEVFIEAKDASGQTGAYTQQLTEPDSELRVRTAKAVYRPGDTIEVTLESPESALPVSVQLLRRTRHGDVVLAARDVGLRAGRARFAFLTDAADARYSGVLFVSAVALRDRVGPRRPSYTPVQEADDPVEAASRAVLFPHDNALHVDVKLAKASYKPGEQATATLTVSGPQDPDGDDREPAPSALGLVAVDEAVEERNRTDSDFGNVGGQSFLFRWRSGFENGGVVGGVTLAGLERMELKGPAPADLQLAAEVLLGSLKFEPEIADSAPPSDLASTYSGLLDPQLAPARKALAEYIKVHLEAPVSAAQLTALLAQSGIAFEALRDPWDEPYEIADATTNWGQRSLILRSSGPDKRRGTHDDFSVLLASWIWTAPFQRTLQHLVDGFHDRTGGFIRDMAALESEAKVEAIALDAWRDPWGQAFTYEFTIQQANYQVLLVSAGDPAERVNLANGYYHGGTAASISYFNSERARIENLLKVYAASHSYPTSDAALEAAGVRLAAMDDPWGNGLYATFRARSFYTDTVTTAAYATPGTAPQTRTTITPVTEIADTITLHSAGPNGRPGDEDDFVLATFTRARSQQSARQNTAETPRNQTVRSTRTGALLGVVKDQTGAVIPGATVLATDRDTKAQFEAKTSADGSYVLDPIPAGEYDLRITMPGFMDLLYTEVKVTSPEAMVLDATLRVGAETETVTVSAELATIETNSAQVAGIAIDGLSNLPIEGRMAGGGEARTKVMATPRLRDYFPETLLWRPEIITSADGSAIARFKVADSITTWKLTAAASTRAGNTGGGVAQFRSFQPFFAAFDPPRVLTIGDRIALSVTLRNFMDHALTVQSELKPAPWFRIEGDASQTTPVPSGDSNSPVFHYSASAAVTDAPQQFLTRGAGAGDSIAKPVTVHPEGVPTWVSTSGVLKAGATTFTLNVPADAVAGGDVATLKVYPNLTAHLRDALAAMVDEPHGCAEQITSTAWPSLLVERLGANSSRADRTLSATTHKYLEEAYENLLDKQQPDGGFGYWHSDRYADLALTAYIIQFLTEAGEYVAVVRMS